MLVFDLSDEIVRQVIFCMENQNRRYLLDVEEGRVVRADTLEIAVEQEIIDPQARYQDLPPWKSSDGFNLMQRFLAELPNPQLRGDLNEILISGKRVFRRFKDRLAEHPDAQKRYFVFKYLEMRSIVAEWYNSIRELRGLDTLEIGFEDEIGDLILTDVVIEVPIPVPTAMLEKLDRQAFYESIGDGPSDVLRHLYRRRVAHMPALNEARSVVLTAHNPIGDLCGFLWAVQELLETGRHVVTIEQLYVLPDYRRLGIAEALIDRFERDYIDLRNKYLLFRVYGTTDFRSESLVRRGFRALSMEYLRNQND